MNSSFRNTPEPLIDEMHRELTAGSFDFGKTGYRERKKLLKALKKCILDHQEKMEKAMFLDFKKPAVEVQLTEVYVLKSSINHILKNLRSWMEAKPVATPLVLAGMKGYTKPEAKGTVLIISPWNYPFLLTLGPLACAIAAGNTVMLKPSESTSECCQLIAEIVAEVFTSDQVFVANGDIGISKYVLTKKWNHIYYTGGKEVGKVIMRSAADNLCSITLELGGKSPCIVDETADLGNAAKRIVWGKFLNGGQTCVAPDYLLVHESVKDDLVLRMKTLVETMYKEQPEDMAASVNSKHYLRLKEAIEEARSSGAKVITGGHFDEDNLRIQPMMLENIISTSVLLNDEIFGPVLPILTFRNSDECLSIIKNKEHPLALYIFSSSKRNIKEYLDNTASGTTCINTAIVQFNHPELPFGGIGHSGMGKGHGKYGFDEFSNLRSFVQQKIKFNALDLVRAPYTKLRQLISKITIKYL